MRGLGAGMMPLFVKTEIKLWRRYSGKIWSVAVSPPCSWTNLVAGRFSATSIQNTSAGVNWPFGRHASSPGSSVWCRRQRNGSGTSGLLSRV